MAVTPDQPPVRWHTREASGLELDRALTWWHDGERIEHPNIVEAFNRGVTVRPDGRVVLEFGNDWAFVEVEDCAFGVVAVDELEGAPGLSVRLTNRTAEPLDLGSLDVDVEGALTCRVKGGLGKARFLRTAHVQLAQRLVVEADGVKVVVGEVTLPTSLRPDQLAE